MTNLTVVNLLDKNGKVVGFATGTEQETSTLSQSVWTSSSASRTLNTTAIDSLKSAMTLRVQDYRRSAEANGVMINGNLFATDIASQVKYVGALVHSTKNPLFTTSWKTVNNGYVKIDSQGISDTCLSVLAYIQMCYAWEQSMITSIESSTTIQQLQILDITAGKPSGVLPTQNVPVSDPGTVTTGKLIVSSEATITALTVTGTATVGPLNAAVTKVTTLNSTSITNTGTLSSGATSVASLVSAGALNGATMTTTGITAAKKFKGNSGVPTIARGLGSGTTSIVTMTAGSTDTAGQISVTPAGLITPLSGSPIATITFNNVYATAPFVIIHPSSLNSGALQYQPYVTSSTTGFTLSVSNTGNLSSGIAYTWMYHVIQ